MEAPTQLENENDADDNQKITVVCAAWNSDKILRATSKSVISSDSSTTNSSVLEVSSNEQVKEPKHYIKRKGFPVFLVDSLSNNNNSDLTTVFVVDISTAPIVEKKEMKNESEAGNDGGKKFEILRLRSRIDELEAILQPHMRDGSFFGRPEVTEKMKLQEQVQRLEADMLDDIRGAFGQPPLQRPPAGGFGQPLPFNPQQYQQQQQPQIYHAAVPTQFQQQQQQFESLFPPPPQQQQQQQQQQVQSMFQHRNQNLPPQPSPVPPQSSFPQSISNSNRNLPTPAPTQPPECKQQ